MRYQIHHQKFVDGKLQSTLLAEREIQAAVGDLMATIVAWVSEVRKSSNLPDGEMLALMSEDCEQFVKQKTPTVVVEKTADPDLAKFPLN